MKALGNRVAMLIGRGTVIVVDIQNSVRKGTEQPQEIAAYVELTAFGEDQFTVIEWLQSRSSEKETFLVVGSLMGHLTVFSLEGMNKKIYR